MDTVTLIFLITVPLLYGISIRICNIARCREATYYGYQPPYPVMDVDDRLYIPAIIASLSVIAWCVTVPQPYIPIDNLTPSYSTSNWLWTTFAAYIACFPAGMALGFLLNLLSKNRPESTWVLTVVTILGLAAAGLLIWMYCKVYSPWIVWAPIISTMSFSFILAKRTPEERDYLMRNSNHDNGGATVVYRQTSTSRHNGGRNRSAYNVGYDHDVREYESGASSDSAAIARNHRREEYYYQYQQYLDKAERLLSEAESYVRSAEDNEYWAKEAKDSFKAAEARHDYNMAEKLRYESREARRKADYYYNLYNSQ